VAALHSLPHNFQREAFYKCWTSKEALLKAKGTGLRGELDEVEILFNLEDGVRVNSTVPNWTLVELNPGDGYVGALVVQGPECRLICFQW
jgi:4'-phosphopantetheinyl transferase